MLMQSAEDASRPARTPPVTLREGFTLPGRNLKIQEFHDRLRALLAEPPLKIYIDTSVLMWLLRISAVARREFLNWCEVRDHQVFITTWCAHELYRHLKEHSVLDQIRQRIGDQKTVLEDVVRFVDQSYDDSSCVGTEYANRAAAIEGFRNSLGVINRNLSHFQKNSMDSAYDTAEAEITQFVNARSVWTNATNIIASILPEFLHRVEGRLPPGFEDRSKEENQFGDFVFWREVLEDAQPNPVLILTNDRKTDWLHAFSTIENYEGKSLGRRSAPGVDAQCPHPFLTFEANQRGISKLEILDVGILALFLEMEHPQSTRHLVAAAFPRGFDDRPIPNWAALGISRPPECAVTDLASVTAQSLRAEPATNPLRRILRLLQRGGREDVLSVVPTAVFPELLPTLSSSEAAALGKAFVRAIAMYPGSHSFADVLNAAGQAYPYSQSALYLGMLLGVYFANNNEVRRTPAGEMAQAVFTLTSESYAGSALERIDSILETENVWLLAKPTAAPESVLVAFEFQNEIDVVPAVVSISVASNEIFDSSAAEQRKLQTFFPSGECTVGELVRLIAREFTVPLDAIVTEFELDKLLTWEEGAGLGQMRTDLRKVATAIEMLLEDPTNE